MRNWFLGASLVLMVACSGAENTANLPKDSLRISNTTMGNAIVNEPYTASVGVLGGVSPYIITLVDGKLPAGVNLSSTTLSGTPTEKGTFNFSVQVTDANLSTKVQKYTLVVTDKPPPDLTLQLPGTPVKTATRIPVVLNNAENVAGGRFTMTLPEGLTVKSVQPAIGKPLVVWYINKNNLLTVDFAFTQKFFRGRNALFLEVESSKEAGVFVPSVGASNYDLRDGNARKLAGTDLLTPPAPPAAKPQEPVKPADTGTSGTTPSPSTSTPAGGAEGTQIQNPTGDPVDPANQPSTEQPAGDTTNQPSTNPDQTGGETETDRNNVAPPNTSNPPQNGNDSENRPSPSQPPVDSGNEGRP